MRLLPDRQRNHALSAHTGRDEDRVALVEAYAKENGFWRGDDYAPIYTDTLHLDMGTIVPAISGPKRPQDFVALTEGKTAFRREMEETFKRPMGKEVAVCGEDYTMESGKVVIASITSCTNTSNPYVMIGAGLGCAQGRSFGDEPQALGENLPRPRLASCVRLSRSGWTARRSGSSRL